jgi:hypothetical protein
MPHLLPRLFTPKRVGILLSSLVILSLAFYFWFECFVSRKWAFMERSIDELEQEARREATSREPLRTPAVAGDAWPFYAAALKTFQQGRLRVNAEGFLAGSPNVDRESILKSLLSAASAIDQLREGARHSDALRHPEAIVPVRRMEETSVAIELARAAACQARVLVEEGKLREALELLLDVAQFGRDAMACLGGRGYSHGLSVIEEALEELRDQVVLHTWGPEELSRLAGALEVLDRTLPSDNSQLKQALAESGRMMLVEDPVVISTSLNGEIGRRTMGPDWVHLFSMRLYKADAFERWRALIAPDWETSWADRVGSSELSRLGYGILVQTGSGLECWTKLRLLRAAVVFQAGLPVPDLDDPFGSKMKSALSPEGLKVWSVGLDKVDDGGRGPWKRRQRPEESVSVPDIVLEVKR